MKSALWSLNTNTTQLQLECACLEAGVERVRNCSFNMAKATKQLIERFWLIKEKWTTNTFWNILL